MRHRENNQHAHADRGAHRPSEPEEWRAIPSAPGYMASSQGRILGKNGEPRKLRLDHAGYLTVTLFLNGKQRFCRVGRLICEAFNGPAPTSEHEAAHGDGVRSNNWSYNLRWATYAENRDDMKRHGTWPAREQHPRAGLTEESVQEIRAAHAAAMGMTRARRGTRPALAAKYGVSIHVIKDVLTNRSWKSEIGK